MIFNKLEGKYNFQHPLIKANTKHINFLWRRMLQIYFALLVQCRVICEVYFEDWLEKPVLFPSRNGLCSWDSLMLLLCDHP